VSLYSGTARNAAAENTRVVAKSMGLNKANTDGLSDALVREITDKLVKLSEPLHLDAHELRDLNAIIAAHLIELAQGKPTAAKTDRWADAALADLKTRHVSLKRVRAVIHDCNEWLKAEHPGVHQALKDSKGLGNHPKLVRLLTDRFLAAESEKERSKRSAKWMGKARGEQAADPVKAPAGGLLAGNPAPSGSLGAAALRSLARNPLGAADDAA
jgi:hypothetical protein